MITPPTNVLSKLLLPPRVRISAITSECLELLKYRKRGEFEAKKDTLDLSDELSAVKVFVEQWSTVQLALSKAGLSNNRATNLYQLNDMLNTRVPSICVSNPAVGSFLSKWGVKNITQSVDDDEAALQMGIQASVMQMGIHASATDDTALESELESELAVVDNAIAYRLSRWMSSFPENPDDVQWPTSFTNAEKKEMRDFVRAFLGDDTEMWSEDRTSEELASDVAEIRNSDDFAEFPVEKGKAASIIQQVLKDVRNTKARSESRSKSRSKSRSERSQSGDAVDTQTDEHKRSQKRRRDSEDEDDSDGEESGDQRKRSRTEPTRGRTRRRAGSPLKRQLARTTTEEDEMLMDDHVGGQNMTLDEDDEDFVPEDME
jgi:hypothetical protein